MRDLIRQLVIFAFVALVLATTLGYIDFRFLEPGRVPPCDPAKLPAGRICLSTALSEWGDRIVWVDARGEDAYERGTIKATSVFPLRNDAKAQDLLAEAMPTLHQAGMNNQCVVIFCDRNCNSSTDIANILKEYQVEAPVFVLEGGWDEIKKNPSLAP